MPVGRVRRLTVPLQTGAAAYSCIVAGRRIARGALRVSAPPPPSGDHRIGVRERDGFGELYDRTTGARFVPRGSNYIRLGPQVDTFGRHQVYHSNFIVGAYEATRAEAALARMAASGYNVVRVFLNTTCAQGCSTNTRTGEISSAYVANLVDFLRRARSHRIFVMLTGDWLPGGAAYDAIGAGIRRDWFDHVNIVFLSPQGVQMSVLFWQGLIRELIRQRAPLDAVFAYSLWNEAVVVSISPPVHALDRFGHHGERRVSYDMASNVDRKRIIDDAFVHYIDQVRSAILPDRPDCARHDGLLPRHRAESGSTGRRSPRSHPRSHRALIPPTSSTSTRTRAMRSDSRSSWRTTASTVRSRSRRCRSGGSRRLDQQDDGGEERGWDEQDGGLPRAEALRVAPPRPRESASAGLGRAWHCADARRSWPCARLPRGSARAGRGRR